MPLAAEEEHHEEHRLTIDRAAAEVEEVGALHAGQEVPVAYREV